jgi:hypothetical protein
VNRHHLAGASGEITESRARLLYGRATDLDGLRARWTALRSDAIAGVAGVTTAGDWWGVLRHPIDATPPPPDDAFAACFAAVPLVLDSPDPQLLLAGSPAPGAGFIQIMRARVPDRVGWTAADEVAIPRYAAARPDFLGTLRVWHGDRLTVVDSFSSEAEARAGEQRGAAPDDQPVYDAWFAFLSEVEWHDLTAPW